MLPLWGSTLLPENGFGGKGVEPAKMQGRDLEIFSASQGITTDDKSGGLAADLCQAG